VPVYRLPEEHVFPHPSLAEPDGLLGVGGDLHPRRILLGVANGIFPWYSEGRPILWFSPNPRFVLVPSEMRISRSLAKRLRRGDYEVRLDTAFSEVIAHCAKEPRPGQSGTWITTEMKKAYRRLHELGYAHSAEVYQEGQLVGGLYGVSVGSLFSGESMFAHASDASKVALVWLVQQLAIWGIQLVDCQVHTEHLERFGAKHVPRPDYLHRVGMLTSQVGRVGRWCFDPGFTPDSRGGL
jgi:leucyl/phenylalanyl-tRNA--protein transferase